jgi:hypothetical protein
LDTQREITLAALRAEFPRFRIWIEAAPSGYRFAASRQRPGSGLHTVITTDPAELRATLAAAQTSQYADAHGQVATPGVPLQRLPE